MGVDIRPLKNELRKKYRTYRENLPGAEKKGKDEKIFNRLVGSFCFKEAKLVYVFISTPIEVDTRRLIKHCWKTGKRVCVPKCLEEKGKMKFYEITSWDDVAVGKFKLLEPDPERCRQVKSGKKKGLAVVPGLSFDPEGYRLGFGMGYYDRFLSKFSGRKVGICYNACIAPALPHGRYDVPVDYLFTEKYVKKIK